MCWLSWSMGASASWNTPAGLNRDWFYREIKEYYVICKNDGLNAGGLIFIGPCLANIFAECNQQDEMFHNLFISVRRSTCFRRVFRPTSGAKYCPYSVRYLSDRYCYLLLASRLAAGSNLDTSCFWYSGNPVFRCKMFRHLLFLVQRKSSV